MNTLITELRKGSSAKIISLFFIILSGWWASMFLRGLTEGSENNYFTLIYPLLSLIGGVLGLISAQKWGGVKSLLGRAISSLSLGLLAQFLGQACYAYYIYVSGIEVPYPSLGDVGFFGSILLYLYGIYLLGRVAGVHLSLQSLRARVISIFIPLVLLSLSYIIFLSNYEYDWSLPMNVFLDFGYPLGQALYISLAILTFLLSRKVLGGMMKGPIMFIIVALGVQYISDYTFLYQASRGTWYVGGYNDYLYFVSYFLMTASLIYIGSIFNKIKEI
jgi:hypothetical protein